MLFRSPGLQNLLADPVLLHIQPPGIDQRKDKENGQDSVKQNEEGIVPVNGFPAFLVGFNRSQRTQLAQIIAAGKLRVREEHIQVEQRLKNEEQDTSAPLAAGAGTKAHDHIAETGFPVSVPERLHQVLQFFADAPKQTEEPSE